MTAPLAAIEIQLNQINLLNLDVNPSLGGGVAAVVGSVLAQGPTTGAIWNKTSAPNTGWQQLNQSFAWYSVATYGATGDGVTDDTTAVQAAINACAAAGGGVVYFPHGTYAVTQIAITGNNVQLLGTGGGSEILWKWNAATAAGSMLAITGGAQHTRVSLLRFNGSQLTNPSATRENHLLSIGDGTACVETQVFDCKFEGMIAASGDGVHIQGGNIALVSRAWVCRNTFDGCSRFSIGVRQDFEYLWLEENFLTNCDTEIALVSNIDRTGNAAIIRANQIKHTSGTIAQALRIEGPTTQVYTRFICAENIIYQGFCTLARATDTVWNGNVCTSGVYAIADAVLRVFDATTNTLITNNILDRVTGASAGVIVSLEKSTGAPVVTRIGPNLLINEVANAGFIKITDCSQWLVSKNLCRSSAGFGASTVYGIEIDAVTVAVTTGQIGPSNQITGASGSMAAAIRLLCNGADIDDISVVGNQGAQCDYGLWQEISGGGAYNGQLLWGGTNNFASAVGDVNQVGVSSALRIGFNAGTFGAVAWSGTGSPEGVVTAQPGSTYMNLSGGQSSTFWYKESLTGNTGWRAVGDVPLVFGAGTAGTAATALFMAPGFVTTPTATELQIALSRPGTLRNLRVQPAGVGTDAATVTYTVRKNGADTAIVVALANTSAAQGSDTTHTVTAVAGDLVSISIVKSGVVSAGQVAPIASIGLA